MKRSSLPFPRDRGPTSIVYCRRGNHAQKEPSLAVSSSATAESDPLSGSLASQLEVAIPVLEANKWVSQPQLANIRVRIANSANPVPTAGRSVLAQFLLDNRLLPRDQVADLDTIIRAQVTLPQFNLVKKIGAGGMGTVFLARHLSSNRMVALKTINARLADDKDFVERFHREARALEKVGNEFIAEIIDCGESGNTCWLAMEYIDGPSLMNLLKEHRVLPERYALHLIKQVAEGLNHVWQKAGLVHRDIKPENILVRRSRSGDELFPLSDVAKLIDFGLVKSNNDDDRLTQTGMTIGTPLYMSPEQVRGEQLDCRSDIYGLGSTLYHLITGVTPFTGSSPGAIMSAHLTEAIPDPADRVPSLSKATRQLVMTAMAKGIEQRYLTFEGFIQACDAALNGSEHKSSTMPRLLRKPMVLKNPVKRSGEFSAEGVDLNSPKAATPPKEHITGAIRRPSAPTSATAPLSTLARVSNPLTSGPSATEPSTAKTRAPGAVNPANLSPNVKPTTATVKSPTARHSNRMNAVDTSAISGAGQSPLTAKLSRTQPTSPPRNNAAVNASSSDISMPMAPDPATSSAAFVEQPASPGIGLLPWVVLGFASIALLIYIALLFF